MRAAVNNCRLHAGHHTGQASGPIGMMNVEGRLMKMSALLSFSRVLAAAG